MKYFEGMGLAVFAAAVAVAPLSAKALTLDPGLQSFQIDCNCSNFSFTGTVGWSFSVNTPINISYLGVYDENGDGLAVSKDVGLWDLGTSSLLASATVPSGTAGVLQGQFRYSPITSLQLSPGNNYVIGASYVPQGGNPDPDWYQLVTSQNSFASWIAYGTPAEVVGSTLSMPNPSSQPPFGIYGPNLAATLPAESAPGPLPLLGAGMAFSWSRRIRRKVASGSNPSV